MVKGTSIYNKQKTPGEQLSLSAITKQQSVSFWVIGKETSIITSVNTNVHFNKIELFGLSAASRNNKTELYIKPI